LSAESDVSSQTANPFLTVASGPEQRNKRSASVCNQFVKKMSTSRDLSARQRDT